ncbi:hypothetical protein EPUL_001660 [Erysiphe pulchra]|uniref:Uncharacterized protein n=1 Tax=Erysiphe pulchra TaxID=225359 RepID=A0A2S4PT20_9PEZI|nr:hypothetical protein EPUL_001660 [Erysiphe pulchra]
MDTDPALVELIPSHLWSLPYLRLLGILTAATRINSVRVGEVCAASQTDVSYTPPMTNSITPTAGYRSLESLHQLSPPTMFLTPKINLIHNNIKPIPPNYNDITLLQQPKNISTTEFLALSQQAGNTNFALSMRDLDLPLDSQMQRSTTVQINNTIIVIAKDADPKIFLASHYHEYLDVFDRKQANELPPHRP